CAARRAVHGTRRRGQRRADGHAARAAGRSGNPRTGDAQRRRGLGSRHACRRDDWRSSGALRAARGGRPAKLPVGLPRHGAQRMIATQAPGLLRAAWFIARKDMTIEFRTRTAFFSSLVFAVLGLCIFYFAWDATAVSAIDLAPGILWVILTYSGLLGLQRSFSIEE